MLPTACTDITDVFSCGNSRWQLKQIYYDLFLDVEIISQVPNTIPVTCIGLNTTDIWYKAFFLFFLKNHISIVLPRISLSHFVSVYYCLQPWTASHLHPQNLPDHSQPVMVHHCGTMCTSEEEKKKKEEKIQAQRAGHHDNYPLWQMSQHVNVFSNRSFTLFSCSMSSTRLTALQRQTTCRPKTKTSTLQFLRSLTVGV